MPWLATDGNSRDQTNTALAEITTVDPDTYPVWIRICVRIQSGNQLFLRQGTSAYP